MRKVYMISSIVFVLLSISCVAWSNSKDVRPNKNQWYLNDDENRAVNIGWESMWNLYELVHDSDKTTVRIAVIDTGADYGNFEIKDSLVAQDDLNNDCVGHGTKVIGIICASQYKGKVVGVSDSKYTEILPIKVTEGANKEEPVSSTKKLIQAIKTAETYECDICNICLNTVKDDNQIPSFNGLEIIDEVETELVENGNYNEIQRDKIIEDIEALDYLGIDIKSIESIEFKGEKNAVYNIAVNEDITDTIIINQGVNGITMEVFEDGKHDILLVKEDGTMYLDGKKVTVEEDTISNSYIPENDAVALSEVGGVQWYKSSEAPSKLKNASYKSFSKYPDWTCTSVNFHKSLKAIAYSTAVGILSGVSKGLLGIVVNGALGFFSSTLYELANYDGNSQCISFKYYIVRGKTNNRYLKLKRITWPRKNYKPNNKSVITYEYGQVI